MDIMKEALMKIKELQDLIMAGGGMQDMEGSPGEEAKESPMEEKKEQLNGERDDAKDSDRAPILGLMNEQVEDPRSRGPLSFNEKAKMFNKKK